MNQREYEDRQSWLESDVMRARQRLFLAESGSASGRVVVNRRRSLEQAEAAYDRFMAGGWMEDDEALAQ
jgi:ribosomal protein L34